MLAEGLAPSLSGDSTSSKPVRLGWGPQLLEESFSESERPRGRAGWVAGGRQGQSIAPRQRGHPQQGRGRVQSVVTNRTSRPGLIPHRGSSASLLRGRATGAWWGKDPEAWRETALRSLVPSDLARAGLSLSPSVSLPASWALPCPHTHGAPFSRPPSSTQEPVSWQQSLSGQVLWVEVSPPRWLPTVAPNPVTRL